MAPTSGSPSLPTIALIDGCMRQPKLRLAPNSVRFSIEKAKNLIGSTEIPTVMQAGAFQNPRELTLHGSNGYNCGS